MGKDLKKNSKKKDYLGINIPADLNEKLLKRSNEIGIPKTSLVIFILSNYFENAENLKAIKDGVDIAKRTL